VVSRVLLVLSISGFPVAVMASEDSPNGRATGSGSADAGGAVSTPAPPDDARERSASDQSSGQEDSRTVHRRDKAGPADRERVARRSAGGSTSYVNGLVALGIVLGMIAAGALAFKRWGSHLRSAVGSGGRHLEIVSRLALSPRQSICLIRIGRQLVLVGVTSDRITRLLVIDDPRTVGELMDSARGASGTGLGSTFGRLFSSQASSFQDDAEQDEPAAELPFTPDGRHYLQTRLELSGLMEKIRSRRVSTEENATSGRDEAVREPIAIA